MLDHKKELIVFVKKQHTHMKGKSTVNINNILRSHSTGQTSDCQNKSTKSRTIRTESHDVTEETF